MNTQDMLKALIPTGIDEAYILSEKDGQRQATKYEGTSKLATYHQTISGCDCQAGANGVTCRHLKMWQGNYAIGQGAPYALCREFSEQALQAIGHPCDNVDAGLLPETLLHSMQAKGIARVETEDGSTVKRVVLVRTFLGRKKYYKFVAYLLTCDD